MNKSIDNQSSLTLNKVFRHLVEDIFACFLQPDYEDNLYLYEHRIHKSKKQCANYILKQANQPGGARSIAIFNGLLDCGLLRWRVKDKTVFAVCRSEMAAIVKAICMGGLSTPIAAMETLYQNVLSVTAKEPLSFFLFIQSLKVLDGIFNENRFASA